MKEYIIYAISMLVGLGISISRSYSKSKSISIKHVIYSFFCAVGLTILIVDYNHKVASIRPIVGVIVLASFLSTEIMEFLHDYLPDFIKKYFKKHD